MKNTILFTTLLLSSSCALAANGYAGINAGIAKQKAGIEGASVSQDETGFKAYGGYQFDPHIGIEGGYARFGEMSGSAQGATVGAKPTSFYAAVTGTMPATAQMNVFVKLGVARSDTDVYATYRGQREEIDMTRNSALLGTGFQYKFSNNLSLVGEYEYFGKVVKDHESGLYLKASLISIGLRLGF